MKAPEGARSQGPPRKGRSDRVAARRAGDGQGWTRNRTASSTPSAPATAAPRTPSTSAPSRAWVASTSRPSSTPTPRWPSPSSTTARRHSPRPICSTTGWCRSSTSRDRAAAVLTDRGTEYCGNPERHEYELYLAVENIDHTRTGEVPADQRHRRAPAQDDAQRVLPRRLPQEDLRHDRELQADLDAWLDQYNNKRPHQGRWCFGKTPMRTFLDSLDIAKEKLIQH